MPVLETTLAGLLLWALIGYLLGSVPFGLVIARLLGLGDLRKIGSGNIGTDLMFFAVYEPVTQYLTPPSIEGGTVTAAREATVWTLFHYGISGWGMYARSNNTRAMFRSRRRSSSQGFSQNLLRISTA